MRRFISSFITLKENLLKLILPYFSAFINVETTLNEIALRQVLYGDVLLYWLGECRDCYRKHFRLRFCSRFSCFAQDTGM